MRGTSRKPETGLDRLDYVLLALIGCLGLVWVRLFFIYTAVTAGCAEHIASFGYVATGWLQGQTVWSLLYAIAVLSALFCLTVAATRHRPLLSAATVFRIILLIGFILIALMFRSLVSPDPRPPDGIIRLTVTESGVFFDPPRRENVFIHNNPNDRTLFIQNACVFVDRNKIVVAEPSMQVDSKISILFESLFGRKGALIARYQSHQLYLDMSETDRSLILDAIPVKPALKDWRYQPPQL